MKTPKFHNAKGNPLVLLLFIFFSSQLFSQVHLVNREWTISLDKNSPIDWADSMVDDEGNSFITASKRVSATQVNLTLSKLDDNGDLVWQSEYGSSGNQSYGVSLVQDTSGNIYVAGTKSSITTEDFDYLLIKYDTSGTKIWEHSWDGGNNKNDVPTAIAVDLNGHSYLTGISYNSNEIPDCATLKIDSVGLLSWSKKYDFAAKEDAGLFISLGNSFASQQNEILVFGASQDSTNTYEYFQLKYNSVGTQVGNTIREEGVDNQEDVSLAIAQDQNGKFYAAGHYLTADTLKPYGIQVFRYDSTGLSKDWGYKYTSANPFQVFDLVTFGSGEILVLASNKIDSLQSALFLLQIDEAGGLAQKEFWPFRAKESIGRSVGYTHSNGVFAIASEVTDLDSERSFVRLIQCKDSIKVTWQRTYSTESNKHIPVGIVVIDSLTTRLAVLQGDTGSWDHDCVQYKVKERDVTFLFDQDTLPTYTDDEVVIRFSTAVVDTNFVDDLNRIFGRVGDIITDTALISDINDKLETNDDFENWTLQKVYPNLTTKNNFVTTRLGRQVDIPDLWTTFILLLGRADVKDEEAVCDSLNSIPDLIHWAHPNFAVQLHGDPAG
jgi:hypothetical protein